MYYTYPFILERLSISLPNQWPKTRWCIGCKCIAIDFFQDTCDKNKTKQTKQNKTKQNKKKKKKKKKKNTHFGTTPGHAERFLLGGGHSHYGGDADVGLQRAPVFSAAITQCPHIFADCLCCHPKTPHFLVKCGLFDRSHPKTPYFLHSAATGSYFLFQFHRQIDHFCNFQRFVSNSCF